MTQDTTQYANAVAALILVTLYKKHDHQPRDIARQIDDAFPAAANQMGVPESDSLGLLRLTHEAIEIFLSKTDWNEYHIVLTGPHAHLVDAQVMLNKRISYMT